ncbi:hypothetical protein QFC21_001514 [Naganishia friedmannii]|uniref:Uncharacterized protein n=1 Tax=Naganishia friedmannii TaxID=89922 RepID=A0ACC2W4P2_9TREE|nr:hypothetical protein QFC21_001514 [Naganishia friedmannii]
MAVMPPGSSSSHSSHKEGGSSSNGFTNGYPAYQDRNREHGKASANDHEIDQPPYPNAYASTASAGDSEVNMAGIGSGSGPSSPRISKRIHGHMMGGSVSAGLTGHGGYGTGGASGSAIGLTELRGESASAPSSPNVGRHTARMGGPAPGLTLAGVSPDLSAPSSRNSLRYEATHHTGQPSYDSASSQHHQHQQMQPHLMPQHHSRPSMSLSNSHGHSQSQQYNRGYSRQGAGRQHSFDQQPIPADSSRNQQVQHQYTHAQSPASATATMASIPPSDWQVAVRPPNRSATDPSSPYGINHSPAMSQGSNGQGTPRADSHSVFAAQQSSTPRPVEPERAVTADRIPQQQYSLPANTRNMLPPPIPPLSPSRHLRTGSRNANPSSQSKASSGTTVTGLGISTGHTDMSRNRAGGIPSPTRSTRSLTSQQQQAQGQPLPPSESSHHGHSVEVHGGNAGDRRDQQGESSVVESASASVNHSHQQSGSSNAQHHSMASSQSAMTSGVLCGACSTAVKGQCRDCNKVVAAKFFPVDDSDGSYPLCERDYFARLDLICGKCDKALRGAYITACNQKYHVEHFTCSVCPTVFGPQDSYYEHGDEVYCHFHYSTRFATKCVGCAHAILKQFVEINRNQKDECWHPECYMIHKFWNVKLISKFQNTPVNSAHASASSVLDPDAVPEEQKETAETLKAKQIRMETQVEQIWRVLSAFEESSAACISEMLRSVSANEYLDGVLMAERFILHVEILFAVIDDLEAQFAMENARGMSHSREAKMLCRKTVNFFSLLAHNQETPEQKAMITQELLALVTGLAHYLKILIRIALTGALKLEREHGNVNALDFMLQRLSLLARDDADPSVPVRGQGIQRNHLEPQEIRRPPGFTASTKGIAYGYRSLAPEVVGESVLKGRSLTWLGNLDQCMVCENTVEEDCVRLGLFERWHAKCLRCVECSTTAAVTIEEPPLPEEGMPKPFVRRPPPKAEEFVYEARTMVSMNAVEVTTIFCVIHRSNRSKPGFESVTRLEQYAYLLNVALRRLCGKLQIQGTVSALPLDAATHTDHPHPLYDAYRDSSDIKRLKSVNLDRKTSAHARMPQRSTVVESPSGKIARAGGSSSARSAEGVPPLPSDGRSDSPAESFGRGRTPGKHTPSATTPYHSSGSPSPAGKVDVIRPAFARNNTSVCIVNETADLSPEDDPPLSPSHDDSPFDHEEGVTLADIPAIVEAEQARLTHRNTAMGDDRPLISELSALDALIVKHFALLALTKSILAPYIDLEEMLELVEVRKNQWWNKIFKGGKDKKDIKRKGVFGVPLEILVEKTGSDSQLGATNTQIRVPEFIDNIISAMKQMDMSVEGIFRKNGNIKRLNTVTEALDRDPSSVNLADDNPVQLAALLKKFLRDLPDPLMTFRLHRLFCAAENITDPEEKTRCLHLIICMLPKTNRDTMEVLFVFLKWVASFSHVDEETGSKMDIANLATVICPSILYAKGQNAMRDDSFVAIRAIQTLVERQEEFYVVPKELMFVLDDRVSLLFAQNMDLPPKEIFKHCNNYAEVRRTGRKPPSSKDKEKEKERDKDKEKGNKDRERERERVGGVVGGGDNLNAAGQFALDNSLFNAGHSAHWSGRHAPPSIPLYRPGSNSGSRPSSWVDAGNSPASGGGGGPPHYLAAAAQASSPSRRMFHTGGGGGGSGGGNDSRRGSVGNSSPSMPASERRERSVERSRSPGGGGGIERQQR